MHSKRSDRSPSRGSSVLVMLAAACGSGSAKSAPPSSPRPRRSGPRPPTCPASAPASPPTAIKLGVSLIDYKCIESYVDSIYVEPGDDVRATSSTTSTSTAASTAARSCPTTRRSARSSSAAALAACTSFTEDDHVFAVIGSMYDPSGDAQLCITKQHKTLLITDSLTQEMIDKAPPGVAAHAQHHRRPAAEGRDVAGEVAAHPRRQEGRGAHRDRRDAAGQVGRRPHAAGDRRAAGHRGGADDHRHRHDRRADRSSTASSSGGRPST